jgi:hypothetical protein
METHLKQNTMKTKSKIDKTGSMTIEADMNLNDPIDWSIFNEFLIDLNSIEETKAIELLKSKGYVIFKPTYKKL